MSQEKRKELLDKAYQSIAEKKDKVENDYYRLQYHVMPPAGWLNDPNGFIQFDGVYHLFYQFHPWAPESGLKYWGHYTSQNLVNWEEQPIALTPSKWYETHGCYSGSAVDDDGVLTLMYTGNVKDDGVRSSYQCLVTSADGINFKKSEGNPVIDKQPEGYTAHFRDPKVWKKDGTWYLVIGAQTVAEEGRVLLYKSANLKEWDLIGEVVGSNLNGLDNFGYMWECPDLFTLGEKEVLIVLPQGLEAQGDLYNNIYQAGYLVGELDYETGEFNHGEFIELDRGFDFYAAQTTLDQQGRRIMIAWMGMPEEDEKYAERENGWIHAMTLPRVLELREDNKLIQKPVPELKQLRQEKIDYKKVKIKDEELELDQICGDVVELIAEFEIEDASEFGIKVRCAQDGSEETVIKYDTNNQKLSLNRNKSGRGESGIRRCLLESDSMVKLHLFIDTSSLELFANEGEEVFSSRLYPSKESQGIKFFAQDGQVTLKKVTKWNLE
ncbi:sucrose-6-phosphate hydrolase [Halobacteroides halobius DSM 5150]|uniref:Sucrose-6-phosphate hydrolase n=1 Tax=Halobacteroides halobius (strain ATCC 35273 / DSM 5150 / MD-1) TaxID=748449 RepID=L0K9P8_HALHC|nr:sucrose-6-phosphate hydrolase [Halobacteroides halobius]AGB40803.1 sucrose-6-phosphate hydrolase [Halobacteroides halobius DSM 5150]